MEFIKIVNSASKLRRLMFGNEIDTRESSDAVLVHGIPENRNRPTYELNINIGAL